MYVCVVQWIVQGVKKVKKEHTKTRKAKVSKKVKRLKGAYLYFHYVNMYYKGIISVKLTKRVSIFLSISRFPITYEFPYRGALRERKFPIFISFA